MPITILSSEIDPQVVLEHGYDRWLKKLERFFETYPGVQLKNRTTYSIQFLYKDLIKVDLLASPWWDSVSQFSLFLDKIPVQNRFS